MNTLGERIKLLRGDTTQAVFAASLGIPQMTLSNYETGKREIPLRHLIVPLLVLVLIGFSLVAALCARVMFNRKKS